MDTRKRPGKRAPIVVRLVCASAAAWLSLTALPAVSGEGCEAALAADYETAFRKWEPLVSRNDGRAQFQLALMYHAGLHVEQDEAMAVRLYHMAAENGVEEAREFLIAGYEHGWFGLPRNEQMASYWINRSADRDPDQAASELPLKG